jgi:hypothetical protein
MAWTTPKTWAALEVVTAAMLNEQISANMNAIWVGTNAGDMEYYSSATAKTRIAKGAAGQFLKSDGSLPAWGAVVGNRQGGNATDWNTPGITNYTPTNVIIQCGSGSIASYGDSVLVVAPTFPVAFSAKPIAVGSVVAADSGGDMIIDCTGTTTTQAGFALHEPGGGVISGTWTVFWIAIGPA